jgi:hypothetical protein
MSLIQISDLQKTSQTVDSSELEKVFGGSDFTGDTIPSDELGNLGTISTDGLHVVTYPSDVISSFSEFTSSDSFTGADSFSLGSTGVF